MPRLGLRGKWTLGVVILLLPSLALIAVGYRRDLEARRQLVTSSLSHTADASAQLVRRFFDDGLHAAVALAGQPDLLELPQEQVVQRLRQLANQRPDLGNLTVFDREGRSVGAVELEGAHKPLDISDRAHFQRVMTEGEPLLSGLVVGRVAPVPLVLAVAPIRSGTGEVVAVASAALRLSVLEELLREIGLARGQFLFLIDPEGQLAIHTGAPGVQPEQQDLSSMPQVRQALLGFPVVDEDYWSPVLKERRVVALQPVPAHGWVVGVSWPVEEALGPLRRAHRGRLLILLGLGLLSAAGAWALGAYFSRPLVRLANASAAFGRGDLSARVEIRSRDEAQRLGEAFNAMAASLQQERQARERFIAAVAHELGNVITPLRTAAELLGRKADSPEDARQLADRILHQSDRAKRLVTDLMDASRIEAGQLTLHPGPHDLCALLRQVVEEQRLQTGREFRVQAPGSLQLSFDADRLAQLVTNLLSNAAKYSPPETPVEVSLEIAGEMAQLQVTDQGAGLTLEQLAHLFEPFGRLHPATGVAGLGMGLFISRAIARAHRGELSAHSLGPDLGATFTLRLPLS